MKYLLIALVLILQIDNLQGKAIGVTIIGVLILVVLVVTSKSFRLTD